METVVLRGWNPTAEVGAGRGVTDAGAGRGVAGADAAVADGRGLDGGREAALAARDGAGESSEGVGEASGDGCGAAGDGVLVGAPAECLVGACVGEACTWVGAVPIDEGRADPVGAARAGSDFVAVAVEWIGANDGPGPAQANHPARIASDPMPSIAIRRTVIAST